MIEVGNGKQIILFDGVCNLCNGAVQFIIKKDRRDRFRFAPLQSEIAQTLLRERHIDSTLVDSLILIKPGEAYYVKSMAALKIANGLGGLWKLTGIFQWVPRPFRDWVYDRVATNRYRLFGKEDTCMVPAPEIEHKFLEMTI